MERLIRVVLFLALASLGLDSAEDLRIKQRLNDLKPPRQVSALRALTELPPPPEPPPPLSIASPAYKAGKNHWRKGDTGN